VYTDSYEGDHRRSIVRPYVITGGRTRAKVDLALETLIETTELGRAILSAALLHPEQRRVLDLCSHRLHSVAEISAHLRIPIGVTRVVVADLAQQQVITIHEPPPATGRQAIQLMERLIHGLRKL